MMHAKLSERRIAGAQALQGRHRRRRAIKGAAGDGLMRRPRRSVTSAGKSGAVMTQAAFRGKAMT
jgi:hypothetical protein